VLPISKGKDITPLDEDELEKIQNKTDEEELRDLRESLAGDKFKYDLVKLTKTVDQVCPYNIVSAPET
jgi:N-acetyltransferase 10